MHQDTTINRRTAIIGLPLALVGVSAAVKGYPDFTPTPASTPAPGILDERALRYAVARLTEASTSHGSTSFVTFAQHVSILASAGDCESIRAAAEGLIDGLYAEHNYYNETRETWIAEESGYHAECVQMDDEALTWTEREAASDWADARHARRRLSMGLDIETEG